MTFDMKAYYLFSKHLLWTYFISSHSPALKEKKCSFLKKSKILRKKCSLLFVRQWLNKQNYLKYVFYSFCVYN